MQPCKICGGTTSHRIDCRYYARPMSVADFTVELQRECPVCKTPGTHDTINDGLKGLKVYGLTTHQIAGLKAHYERVTGRRAETI